MYICNMTLIEVKGDLEAATPIKKQVRPTRSRIGLFPKSHMRKNASINMAIGINTLTKEL